MLNAAQADTLMGKLALFIGTYSRGWTDAQFAIAARNARAMGVDTLIYKVADGGIAWYAPQRITSIRQAIMSAGCGALPYQYSYGMRFGVGQIPAEADLAKATQDAADGLVCLDMEVEWNGQTAAAETLAKLMAGHGTLLISTWADPAQQNWNGVIGALKDVTDVWMPQQYTPWLAAQEGQLTAAGERVIQPTFDLSHEFSASNDPLALAKQAHDARGQGAISLWEYGFATQNPNLVRAIASVMGKPLTSAAPVTLPAPAQPKPTSPAKAAPAPTRTFTYVVKAGDTLSAIAARLGLNWWHDLYLPNQAAIEASARAHGDQGSGGGNLIYPGLKLTYRK